MENSILNSRMDDGRMEDSEYELSIQIQQYFMIVMQHTNFDLELIEPFARLFFYFFGHLSREKRNGRVRREEENMAQT